MARERVRMLVAIVRAEALRCVGVALRELRCDLMRRDRALRVASVTRVALTVALCRASVAMLMPSRALRGCCRDRA